MVKIVNPKMIEMLESIWRTLKYDDIVTMEEGESFEIVTMEEGESFEIVKLNGKYFAIPIS